MPRIAPETKVVDEYAPTYTITVEQEIGSVQYDPDSETPMLKDAIGLACDYFAENFQPQHAHPYVFTVASGGQRMVRVTFEDLEAER